MIQIYYHANMSRNKNIATKAEGRVDYDTILSYFSAFHLQFMKN